MGRETQDTDATDDPAANVPTEELVANPAKYGYVGNGRMAMPAEDLSKRSGRAT